MKFSLNRGITLPVVCLAAGLVLSGSAWQGSIPNFTLKNTENEMVSYRQLKGEILTVIDFWATWCRPCIKSIPELVKMQEELKDHGVQFIGISIDSPRNLTKVKPFSRSLGINYPVLLDTNSELMGMLHVTAVPTLILADRDGRIVWFHEGFNPGDEQVIRQEIWKHLGNSRQ